MALGIVKVAPFIVTCGTVVEGLTRIALADGHGVYFVYRIGADPRPTDKAKRLAHGRRPVVIVPEVMATDGVVLAFIQHLRDESLVLHHGFAAALATNEGYWWVSVMKE